MKRQQLLRTNAEEKMPWLSKGQGHDSGIRKRNDRDRLSVSLSFSVTICLSYSVSLFLSSSLSLCLSISLVLYPFVSFFLSLSLSLTLSTPVQQSRCCLHLSKYSNCMRYHKLYVQPQVLIPVLIPVLACPASFLYCSFRDGSRNFFTFDLQNHVRAVKKHHHQNLKLYRTRNSRHARRLWCIYSLPCILVNWLNVCFDSQPEGSSYPTSNRLDNWLIPSCLDTWLIACTTMLCEYIQATKLHALP